MSAEYLQAVGGPRAGDCLRLACLLCNGASVMACHKSTESARPGLVPESQRRSSTYPGKRIAAARQTLTLVPSSWKGADTAGQACEQTLHEPRRGASTCCCLVVIKTSTCVELAFSNSCLAAGKRGLPRCRAGRLERLFKAGEGLLPACGLAQKSARRQVVAGTAPSCLVFSGDGTSCPKGLHRNPTILLLKLHLSGSLTVMARPEQRNCRSGRQSRAVPGENEAWLTTRFVPPVHDRLYLLVTR